MRQRPLAVAALLLLGLALPVSVPAAEPSAVTAALPVAPPPSAPDAAATDAEIEKAVKLFRETLRAVASNYVEPVGVSELADTAVRAMVARDRWSAYLDEGQYQETRLKRDGAMVGLGLRYNTGPAGLQVVSIVGGSPAEAAGLKAGDIITQIDGVPAAGMDRSTAAAALKGPRGSSVALRVAQAAEGPSADLVVARDLLTLSSVEHKRIGDVGYVRIRQFNRSTGDDVESALKALRADLGEGLRGVVLDLRGNPGGLVKAAVETADAFLESGMILQQVKRGGVVARQVYASEGDLTGGRPLIVLVNGSSASSSEILAGALRDHGRAVLVGARTYGKGVIQSFLPAPDGGAVKLTTARYQTPLGHEVNGVGIEPDYLIDLPADAATGTDPQLDQALSLLR